MSMVLAHGGMPKGYPSHFLHRRMVEEFSICTPRSDPPCTPSMSKLMSSSSMNYSSSGEALTDDGSSTAAPTESDLPDTLAEVLMRQDAAIAKLQEELSEIKAARGRQSRPLVNEQSVNTLEIIMEADFRARLQAELNAVQWPTAKSPFGGNASQTADACSGGRRSNCNPGFQPPRSSPSCRKETTPSAADPSSRKGRKMQTNQGRSPKGMARTPSARSLSPEHKAGGAATQKSLGRISSPSSGRPGRSTPNQCKNAEPGHRTSSGTRVVSGQVPQHPRNPPVSLRMGGQRHGSAPRARSAPRSVSPTRLRPKTLTPSGSTASLRSAHPNSANPCSNREPQDDNSQVDRGASDGTGEVHTAAPAHAKTSRSPGSSEKNPPSPLRPLTAPAPFAQSSTPKSSGSGGELVAVPEMRPLACSRPARRAYSNGQLVDARR